MSGVNVLKPGLSTTIQDRGRWGWQAQGVPVAGPMDPCSHRVANALAGNDPGAATLEVTLMGPELEFEDERRVGVAGAEFDLTVDGCRVSMNAPFTVEAGSRLCFGARTRGARAYVAVAGGIAVPPVLESRATHLISAMGGLDGRVLKAGDRLPLGDPTRAHRVTASPVGPIVRLPRPDARIRVLAGPQADYFSPDALDVLQSTPYRIGSQSDRMGFRLEGPALTHARGADIISDATPLGALQVPASGQPIVLMADRQTAGGYPKVATVIAADMAVAGQLGPGDTLVFGVCTLAEAFAALIAQERALMAVEGSRRAVSDPATIFRSVFGADRVRPHVPLAPMTTFRVGGAAEWLLETRSAEEIVTALRLAASAGVPTTMLGGGSNVLVSDAGVPGLVIRPRGGEIAEVDAAHVRADAAVTINGLVRWTINHGCAGLEAWAGTPGTVGGGIFGNAHFGGRLIGDLVTDVRLASRVGKVSNAGRDEMGFGYDRSRLQESGEVLLSAVFAVSRGEPAALRLVARESLAFRKQTQPLESPSAGCVFQNPDRSRGDAVPKGMPWSAGALVDRAGLKGATIGGARVSPAHGNFIVNDGTATAADIRRLIERCRDEVRRQFGVELRDEIVYMGEY